MASPPPPWANSQPLVEPYGGGAAPWLAQGSQAGSASSPAPTHDMAPPSAPSPHVASTASEAKPKKPRKPRAKKDAAASAGPRAGSSTATPAPGATADGAPGEEEAPARKPKKKVPKKAASRAGSVSTRAGSVARATPAFDGGRAAAEADGRRDGEGTPAPPASTQQQRQLETEQRQRQQRATEDASSDEEEEDEEDEAALDAQDLESIERSHERKKGEIGALMQLMSPAQYDRHEAFQRTGLSKPDVRRLVNHVLSQSITPQLSTLFAAAGKVFIGEMVEEARRVAAAHGHVGALQPAHLAAAFAAHKARLERPGAQAPGAVAKGGAPGTGKRRRMF